jgi:hypothetical protein
MRKWLFVLAAMIVAFVPPALAEIELGIGISPTIGQDSSSNSTTTSATESQGFQKFWNDSTKSVHLGWRTLGILYVSGDFVVVPSFVAQTMSESYDSSTESWSQGVYRPGILSLYDAGFKLKLGPVNLSAQAGINQFYIYRQTDIPDFVAPQLGVNLRLGAGLRFAKHLGLEAVIVTVQPSFKDAADVVTGVFSSDPQLQSASMDRLVNQLIPAIQAVIYL